MVVVVIVVVVVSSSSLPDSVTFVLAAVAVEAMMTECSGPFKALLVTEGGMLE